MQRIRGPGLGRALLLTSSMDLAIILITSFSARSMNAGSKYCVQHFICMLSFHLLFCKTTKSKRLLLSHISELTSDKYVTHPSTKIGSSTARIYPGHFLSLGLSLFIYTLRRLGLMNSKIYFSSNTQAFTLCFKVLFTQRHISGEYEIFNYISLNLQNTICTTLPFAHFVRIGQNGPNSDQCSSFCCSSYY